VGSLLLGCAASFAIWVAGTASCHAAAPISEAACRARANDTAAKLVERIKKQALWHQLSAFQRIADENPGSDGHPNRNTGTPGYKASVDDVAALMRAAGYRVTIQPYNYTKVDVAARQTDKIEQKSDIDYNPIADSFLRRRRTCRGSR
jgi:hypothetical protein